MHNTFAGQVLKYSADSDTTEDKADKDDEEKILRDAIWNAFFDLCLSGGGIADPSTKALFENIKQRPQASP